MPENDITLLQQEQELELQMASMEEIQKGQLFWQNNSYVSLNRNRRIVDLGISLTRNPEFIDTFIKPEKASTSARVLYVPWKDFAGHCYMGIKGLRFEINTETKEIIEHFNWEQHHRRDGYNDIAGKEVLAQAVPEVFTWMQLVKSHPYLSADLHAPLWRPISIIHTGEIIVTQENTGEKQNSFTPDFGVVVQRRFPYTYTRLDEFVEHKNIPETSIRNLDLLRRNWGYENVNSVYYRGIKRLGESSRIFWESPLNHNQIFHIVGDPNKIITAWMNFNNIAIDGSVGDFDDAKKINKPEDYWHNHHEAIGAMVMYLTYVTRVSPDTLESHEFLHTFFEEWKKGIGNEFLSYLKEWTTYGDPFMADGNALDHVLQACTNAIEVYSSVDTRPHNSSLYNPTGYLGHSSKNVWMSDLEKTISVIKVNRDLIGL